MFHIQIIKAVVIVNDNLCVAIKKKSEKVYLCKDCKHIFSCYQNKWRHVKTCKMKGNNNIIVSGK
jgi:phosphopantetheine adenylyltransferase